jgi:hypothetical protein
MQSKEKHLLFSKERRYLKCRGYLYHITMELRSFQYHLRCLSSRAPMARHPAQEAHHVWALKFARVNIPIIAVKMTVGYTILIGEVYIMRHDTPYNM